MTTRSLAKVAVVVQSTTAEAIRDENSLFSNWSCPGDRQKTSARELNVKAISVWGGTMGEPSISPIRCQAAEALRRARKLPVGQ